MLRFAALAILALVAFSLGALAEAATGWRVFATGTGQGQYFSSANASADVRGPKGLAIRVKGTPAKVSWFLSCQGENSIAVGAIYFVAVAGSKTCSLSGTASTEEGGNIRIELLRR